MFIINSDSSIMEKLNKNRQYRSNQGRSPKQIESNNKLLFVSVIGLIVTFVFILLTTH
jgi:hypothetical protein